jgi:hypothetical protein
MSVRTLLQSPAATWTDLNSNTFTVNEDFQCTPLTTTERDALITPSDGMIIFNSTLNLFQGYWLGAWRTFIGATGATGGIGPTGPLGPTGNTGSVTALQATSNTLASTSSDTYTLLDDMVLSLETGTYLVNFNSDVYGGEPSGTGAYGIFVNGGLVDFSERLLILNFGIDGFSPLTSTNMCTTGIATVSGGQQITIAWHSVDVDTFPGTIYSQNRTMTVIKLT